MKAVVVGASGFLGRAVIADLVKRGTRVLALDHRPSKFRDDGAEVVHREADVQDKAALEGHFAGADEIYHFAARLGTSELEYDLREALQVNVFGALNVFEAASKAGVPRVFYASKPSVWLNTYTITKFCAEQIARLTTRYNPVQISILRYLNVYGPGQKLVPVRKVLPIFAAQALRGLPIQVYGDGLQTADMIFSEDAARITVDFLRAPFVETPCDCGTGNEIAVVEIAKAVNRYYGSRAGVQHIGMRKGETDGTRLVADLVSLRNVIGEPSFTSLEQGLELSLRWYAERPGHEIDAALAFYGIHQKYPVSWN